ncbi:MAG: hypothetical protein ACRDOI_27670 [Trebonia sp.]
MDGFDADDAAAALTERLRPPGTAARTARERRYLKSDLQFIGVSVPDARRAVRAAGKENHFTHDF